MIKLKSKVITREEINECIKILHKDYHDAEILVFDRFLDYLKWSLSHEYFNFNNIKEVYKKLTLGNYNSKTNKIHIYIFNNKSEDRYIKASVINTLFHELRHYYQFNFKGSKWGNGNNLTYALDDYRYRSSPIERDADKFAARMMIKHKDSISDALNVYPDWKLKGYE